MIPVAHFDPDDPDGILSGVEVKSDNIERVPVDYKIIESMANYKSDYPVGIHFETSGLTKKDKILSYAISPKPYHASSTRWNNKIEIEANGFVIHDYRFFYKFLRSLKQQIAPFKVIDTKVLSYLLNEQESTAFDKVSRRYANRERASCPIIAELVKHKLTDYYTHNCESADIALSIYLKIQPEIQKRGLDKLALIACAFESFIGEIEYNGIGIELQSAMQMYSRLKREIESIKVNLDTLSGNSISNYNSYPQIGSYLSKVSGKKVTSTAYETLKELKQACPGLMNFIDNLVLYRGYKTLSNNVSGILENVVDSIVFPEYNTTDTKTGRTSTNSPNIQSESKKEGKYEIRRLFIPREGYTFVEWDCDQLEFRVLAMMLKDQELIDAFIAGEDFHQRTGNEIGVDRSIGKTLNFMIMYGGGISGFKKAISNSEVLFTYQDAETYINRYRVKHPKLQNYYDETQAQINKGFVEGYFGRRRHFTTIGEETFRQGANARIQGSAADIVMNICRKLYPKIIDTEIKPVAFLVDATLAEVPIGMERDYMNIVNNVVESINLPVLIKVNFKSGSSWGELKELI